MFNFFSLMKHTGIAFMFLRLCQANELVAETAANENALFYINRAKPNTRQYSRPREERCAFLGGNAGIYAVSAVISQLNHQTDIMQQDLAEFEKGFEACKPIQFNNYGSDEVLVGRAGFLSGVYWLNQTMNTEAFPADAIIDVCRTIVESGRQYSKVKRSSFPLMYQYHSTEYLGAAHGLCSILHMLLESPWFSKKSGTVQIPTDYLADIKRTIDAYVGE